MVEFWASTGAIWRDMLLAEALVLANMEGSSCTFSATAELLVVMFRTVVFTVSVVSDLLCD